MKQIKTRAFKDRLKGHKDSIISLYSPNGPTSGMLFSASKDCCVRAWNLIERKIESKLILSRIPNETIQEEINEDKDKELMFNIKKKEKEINKKFEKISIKASKDELCSVIFSENTVFGGFEDGLICCWNMKSGEILFKCIGHTKKINMLLRISPGSLLSASSDKTMKIWDTMNGNCDCTYTLGFIITLVYFDNNIIYAIGDHSVLITIDHKANKYIKSINFNNISITSLLVEENIVIFGTTDSQINIYRKTDLDTSNYIPYKEIYVQGGWILAIKKLNNNIYVGCDDKSIRVYSLKDYEMLENFKGHDDGVISIEFADNMLYSGSFDHSIRSWDLREMELRVIERKKMIKEDILSRRFEVYNKIMDKKKKRKKGGKKKKKSKLTKSKK